MSRDRRQIGRRRTKIIMSLSGSSALPPSLLGFLIGGLWPTCLPSIRDLVQIARRSPNPSKPSTSEGDSEVDAIHLFESLSFSRCPCRSHRYREWGEEASASESADGVGWRTGGPE
ncbi:unnamed protein product [Musa acuminata var. zebrina]